MFVSCRSRSEKHRNKTDCYQVSHNCHRKVTKLDGSIDNNNNKNEKLSIFPFSGTSDCPSRASILPIVPCININVNKVT